MRKRIIAMVLSVTMVCSLAACGGSDAQPSGDAAQTDEAAAPAESEGADEAAGASEGASSDMNIAMITDSGDITDQSFNQTTYESAKAWAEANGMVFNYYKPESDSDEARNASVDQAVADGANVILMPGYMFAAAVVDQSELYPDVKFSALDVGAGDICEKGVGEGYDYNPANWDVTEYYNTDNVY